MERLLTHTLDLTYKTLFEYLEREFKTQHAKQFYYEENEQTFFRTRIFYKCSKNISVRIKYLSIHALSRIKICEKKQGNYPSQETAFKIPLQQTFYSSIRDFG